MKNSRPGAEMPYRALAEALGLFDEREPLTNVQIAAALGISYRAAYQRTRRLRDMGWLRSVPMWLTVNGEGMAAWKDSAGNYRTWLELYRNPGPGDADAIQAQFDPRNGAGE